MLKDKRIIYDIYKSKIFKASFEITKFEEFLIFLYRILTKRLVNEYNIKDISIEQSLSSLFNTTGYCLLSFNGKFLQSSNFSNELFDTDTLIGKNIFEIIHPHSMLLINKQYPSGLINFSKNVCEREVKISIFTKTSQIKSRISYLISMNEIMSQA